MKKFLLILSLASGFASISAAPTDGLASGTTPVAAPAGSSSGMFARAFNRATVTTPRAAIFIVVVAGVTAGVVAGVTFAGKKAYDRYKAWKKAKADKADVTA